MKSAYRPKKNLGQNFLTDAHIQQKIIQACDLKPEDVVVEIGPGQGVLTRLIAPKVRKLICVETDRDLIEPLNQLLNGPGPLNSRDQGRYVEIVHADFLKFDFQNGPGPLSSRDQVRSIKVIGNIPYYISTPIIEKLIENRQKISSAFLTVQLEFGQRLVAEAGGKDYGSLSCFAQYYADMKILFKIKNTCFKPAPKVDSCFLRLMMNQNGPQNGPGPLCSRDQVRSEEFLFKLIQTAFQQRRKNIVNSLKGMVGKEKLEKALKALGINPNARPENLTLSNYINLCNCLMV